MKISFDFDGTLTEKPMQELAKKFLELGAEVFVTTSRTDKMAGGVILENEDLYQLTDKLCIKRQNITFTAYEDKYTFLGKMDLHFDDSDDEIFLINEYNNSKCMGLLYQHNYNNEAKF